MKWMHLSDIHLNKEFNNVMSNILRDELPRFIRENNLTADYLFVTGDYCDSEYKKDKSLSEDMDLAAKNVADYILEIARSLQVPIGHIYLSPGNHDLERGYEDKEIVTQALEKYYNYKDGFMEKERNYLLKRFLFFHKVSRYIHPTDREWEKCVHRYYEENGFDLLCLNTSIAIYGDENEGELVLDCAAVKEALEGVQPANANKPLFVLAHHSLNFLLEKERENLTYLFKRRPVFYLCGHAHKMAFKYDDEVKTWEIMVGTTKSANGAAPIFSMGEIKMKGTLSNLSFYKYEFEETGKWISYQKISSNTFIDKLVFIGGNHDSQISADAQTIALPLQCSQASELDDRVKAIAKLARFKHAISTLNGSKKYTISLRLLPINAGILIGYALNKRQEISLNYQQGDMVFTDQFQNKCLVFEETTICCDREILPLSSVDLCIYIQAKSRNDGMSSFEMCIKGENPRFIPQNPYVVRFINTENYDESTNLKASASYLVDKIVEHRENLKNMEVNRVKVHLFFNGFLGLAVLLGNQMATTFPVQLYDYEMQEDMYSPSFCLNSNLFRI